MGMKNKAGKVPPRQLKSLSPEKAIDLRGQAFAQIKFDVARLSIVGSAVEALDAALQVFTDVRGTRAQQALVDAAQYRGGQH